MPVPSTMIVFKLTIVLILCGLVISETAFIIADSGAVAIIVQDTLVGTIETILPDLDVKPDRYIHFGGSTPAGYRGYEDLISSASGTEPARPRESASAKPSGFSGVTSRGCPCRRSTQTKPSSRDT